GTGGSKGSGGSQGGAGGSGGSPGGAGGMGGAPVFVPPDCGASPPPWPSSAPALSTTQWTSVAPIPNYYGNGIDIDACNPAIISTAGGSYPASGGDGKTHGVWRSTDGGATWAQLKNLDSPARVRVDPRNSKHLYVVDGVNGGTQGFWRSV